MCSGHLFLFRRKLAEGIFRNPTPSLLLPSPKSLHVPLKSRSISPSKPHAPIQIVQNVSASIGRQSFQWVGPRTQPVSNLSSSSTRTATKTFFPVDTGHCWVTVHTSARVSRPQKSLKNAPGRKIMQAQPPVTVLAPISSLSEPLIFPRKSGKGLE